MSATPRFRLVQGRAIGERSSNQNGPTTPSNNTNSTSPQMNSVPVVSPPSLPELPAVSSHVPTSSTNMMSSMSANDLNYSLPQPAQQQLMMQQQPQHQHPPPPTSSQSHQPSQSQRALTPQTPLSSQMDERSAVTKCVRFLKTLLNLSTNPNNQNNGSLQLSSDNANNPQLVRSLIQDVIFSDLSAEDFTSKLQAALHSQAQPHLLPFLKNTIPSLRMAVRNGEVRVDGLVPPPGFVFNVRSHPPQMIVNLGPTPDQNQPSSLASRLSTPSQMPINNQHNIMPMPPPQPQPPQMVQPPQMHLPSMQPPVQTSQQPNNQQHHVQLQHHSMPPQIQRPMPPPIQQPIQQHHVQPQVPPPVQQVMPPQQQIPHSNQPSTSHPLEAKPEEEQITSGSRVLTESMMKSAILDQKELMHRLTKRMMESCMVEEEALQLISEATETHLREIVAQVAAIAEHRADSMRANENYIPIDDTKRQLRFLEDLDRQEDEIRESREKETLIRMSKNKNTGKETIEKAKEMQRADAEAKRNRDANAAAIAALSGNRTMKNKWEGGNTSSATTQRARIVRVTTRDLHLLVNNDNRFHGTFLREKLSYGGPVADSTI